MRHFRCLTRSPGNVATQPICTAIKYNTAIFRQINKDKVAAHHDALEFPDGQIVLLTFLCEGQQATVLQLPAEPKTVIETKAQQRAAYIG